MKLFTHQEANEVLASVRPRVERLVEARRRLAHLADRLERVRTKMTGNGGGLQPARVRELGDSLAEAATRVDELVDELGLLGVQVKDLDRGLIDFPAKHPDDGSIVLLCWELGEGEVAFWHGVDEGFAGRKPLPF
jgi:hypothetical protein